MAEYYQYKVTCENCGSVTRFISQEQNPIMFRCSGCSQIVVIESGSVYTVSRSFFDSLSKRFNIKACGQLVCVEKKSKHSRQPPNHVENRPKKKAICEKDVKDLHDFLETHQDSSEILQAIVNGKIG